MPRDTGLIPLRKESTCCGAAQRCTQLPAWPLEAGGCTHWARLRHYWSPRALEPVLCNEGRRSEAGSPPRGKTRLATKARHSQNQVKIKLALKSLKWWINKQTAKGALVYAVILETVSSCLLTDVLKIIPASCQQVEKESCPLKACIPFLTAWAQKWHVTSAHSAFRSAGHTVLPRCSVCPGEKRKWVWSIHG